MPKDTMRIGIYTLFLTPGHIGGIETYLRHLLVALGQVDGQNQYIIFVGDHNRSAFSNITYPNFEFVTLPLQPPDNSLPRRILRRLKLLPRHLTQLLESHSLDLLHYPGTTIDQLEINIPCVLTMHDIQQEYFPEFFSAEELAWRRANFIPSAQKAAQIITDAEYTRQTIIEKYDIAPDKITAIPFGVAPRFEAGSSPTEIARIRQKYNLPETFLFFPANAWPHKNHARLFEAVKWLKQEYHLICHLVLSGAFGAEKERLRTMIIDADISAQVHTLGYLPSEELPALYGSATALIFPSLFEGFGIPVLEAMACGCPVICSKATSLPELVGDAAILVDPLNVAEIGEAIYNVLYSNQLRQTLGQKGREQVKNFSWPKAAQQTLMVYKRTHEKQ